MLSQEYFSRTFFEFGTSSFRKNYFILVWKSPKILVQSFFRLWRKVNFLSMTIGTIFYWNQNFNYCSAVIAVIQRKLKIENFSVKANLDRYLYDSLLGLYLDPLCLYWLYIASKSNNTWITCNFCLIFYWYTFSFRDNLIVVLL